MEENEKYRNTNLIKPEVEWLGDGIIVVDLTLPTSVKYAEAASLEIAKK